MRSSSLQSDPELERLIGDIDEHVRVTQERRLTLYRRYLQWAVLWASPLIPRVTTAEALSSALDTLRPPSAWPPSLSPGASSPQGWVGRSAQERIASGRKHARRGRVAGINHLGVLLQPPSHDVEGIGVRIVGNSLEVRLVGERFLITTYKGTLTVDAETTIPATLADAIVGRPIGEIVDHPLLAGCAFPIRRALRGDYYVTMTAATGIVEHCMPWPTLEGSAG